MSPEQAARFIVFERYRDANAALEHFAIIAHPMETATITGELLGDSNEQLRNNLTGGQPNSTSRGWRCPTNPPHNNPQLYSHRSGTTLLLLR